MNKLKSLLAGALVVLVAAPALAQDKKADLANITKVITSQAPDAAKQVKAYLKMYKKDAEAIVALGRVYYDLRDYDNAQVYADQAMKVNKTSGPAYILAGDIAVMKDEGGQASMWYEMATTFDPTNPEGYKKYANVNSKASPSSAVEMLEKLRQNVPGYPVDIISAEIYDRSGQIDKAISAYAKVPLEKMEDYQLASYGTNLFLKGKFEESLKVSTFGNNKFPRNAGLNRLTFFNNTNLKNYDVALAAADKLFNASDSAKISEHDYLYYGYAHAGASNYSEAIAMFQKCLDNAAEDSENRLDALKNMSDAYVKGGDINNGVETYNKYLSIKKDRTANDFNTLAQMYVDAADTAEGDAKTELIKKADAVYADMEEKFPSVQDFILVQRAHLGFALDPDSKDGLAKPHYEKLIEVILAKAEREARDNSRLVEAYRYLGAYYLITLDDAENAKVYFAKILEIDPENPTAKQALEALQ